MCNEMATVLRAPPVKRREMRRLPQTLLLLSILIIFSLPLVHLFQLKASAQPATLGSRLIEAYHPNRQHSRLSKALAHPCKGSIPKNKSLLAEWPWSDWALSRFAAYYDIHRFLCAHWANRSEPAKVLDFGGSRFLAPFNSSINITLSQYPGDDVHSTRYAAGSFDAVAADQVLEHVNFPHLAMLEIHRILRPKGIAMFTSVAYNPIHTAASFGDLWRFMPDGLKTLSLPFRGGIKACGAWGTGDVIATRALEGMGSKAEVRLHVGQKWKQLMKGFNTTESDNAFLVWIVVQK